MLDKTQAAGEPPEEALTCMTQAIYYEAGREPELGMRAVAQVVVNRAMSSPFPASVCGVVRQGAGRPGCQFTFMCDGSLARSPDPVAWARARRIAQAALSGETEPLVGNATHYHADYVFPTWAPTLSKLVKIGAHIFYRWPGAVPRLGPTAVASPIEPTADSHSTAKALTVPAAPMVVDAPQPSPAPLSLLETRAPSDVSLPSGVGKPLATPAPEAPLPPPSRRERRAMPERLLSGGPL